MPNIEVEDLSPQDKRVRPVELVVQDVYSLESEKIQLDKKEKRLIPELIKAFGRGDVDKGQFESCLDVFENTIRTKALTEGMVEAARRGDLKFVEELNTYELDPMNQDINYGTAALVLAVAEKKEEARMMVKKIIDDERRGQVMDKVEKEGKRIIKNN